MRFKSILSATAFIFMAVVFTGCGSSNSLSRAMGDTAVTSPTTSSSTSTASNTWYKKIYTAFLEITTATATDSTGAPTNLKPITEMKEEIKSAIASGDPTSVATALGNPLQKGNFTAVCYGPAWQDDANSATNFVSRPSGDLGIVYRDASDTDTRACAAAEVDALLSGAPSFLNNFIKMQAVLIAAANKAGKSLPAENATENWTTVMPPLSGITMTSATMKQYPKRADGSEVYKTVFEFTDASSKTGTVTIYHSPMNADNTNFEGVITALVPHSSSGGSGDKRGMSMVYSQASGVLKFSVKIAANRSTTSTDFFDSNNEVDFSKQTSSREDFHWILGEFNETTKERKFHYAWQAGGGDGASRTFAMYIPAGTEGTLTGTAWVGFGLDIASLTTSNTPWPKKFYCDWLTGLSGGTSVAKVQRQGLTQASGKFKADTSNNKIAFAPVASCNGSFEVKNAAASFLNGTRTVSSNELQSPPSTTDSPVVAAPTYTLPTE